MHYQYFCIAVAVLFSHILESQQIYYDININDRLMQEDIKRIEDQYDKDLIQGQNFMDAYFNNNNPKIKRSLDNFKIKRKITNFNLPKDMALNKKFIVRKVDKVTDYANLPENMALNENFIISEVDVVTDHTVLYTPEDGLKNENQYLPNTDTYNESDEELFYKNPEVFNILKTQTDLMEKFIKVLENDLKKTLRSFDKEFEDLIGLSDVPPSTIKDAKNYRITTPRPNITIIKNIDELKMREKLKNDPLVKRIIAMAKLKRKQYFEKLSTYTPDPQ